jgi:hypothetical protein
MGFVEPKKINQLQKDLGMKNDGSRIYDSSYKNGIIYDAANNRISNGRYGAWKDATESNVADAFAKAKGWK